MIAIENVPRTIRVLLAVATQALADEIKSMIADEADIEIVALVNSIEDLIPIVQKLRPKVVILHIELDDNWAEYVKQINSLNPTPLTPNPLTPDTLKQYNGTLREWSLTALKIATLSTSETSDSHQAAMLAGAWFHLKSSASQEEFINALQALGPTYEVLRVTWKKPVD